MRGFPSASHDGFRIAKTFARCEPLVPSPRLCGERVRVRGFSAASEMTCQIAIYRIVAFFESSMHDQTKAPLTSPLPGVPGRGTRSHCQFLATNYRSHPRSISQSERTKPGLAPSPYDNPARKTKDREVPVLVLFAGFYLWRARSELINANSSPIVCWTSSV